jgi:hypothetical protein
MLQRVRRSPSRGKTTHGGSASSADTAPIELPTPKLSVGKSLPESLRRRQTVRASSAAGSSPLQLLSNLLWAACGVNRPKGPFGALGITAASASNSQEIDLFVAIEDGVYLFDARQHRLLPVVASDLRTMAIGPAAEERRHEGSSAAYLRRRHRPARPHLQRFRSRTGCGSIAAA